MWDDTTSHWKGSSVLVIQGHPIAITYWREIYSYAKSKKNQWKGTKAKWFEWKVRLAISGKAHALTPSFAGRRREMAAGQP